MDLMSVTTSYKTLNGKYYSFRAPTIEIEIGGTKLVSGKKLQIRELEIDLTSGYEASGCVFYIAGEYEPKNTDFSKDIKVLQIGEEVKASIGYIKTENVFQGYINRIDYEFGTEQEAYQIRVECIDVKGLLMKSRRLEFFAEKSLDKVVSSILGQQPVSSYISGKQIDSCPQEDIPLRANMLTEYELIVEQAEKIGYEFFVVQGKVYFREKEKVSSAIMKLSPKHGILNARLTLSGQSLFKTAEIRSIDEESAKVITGKANISGKFSKGGSGSKLLGSSKQVFYEAGIKDAAEAQKRAKVRVEKAAEEFGILECECIGIPEIGPGRFVEIEGLADIVDQKYYITQVQHIFDSEGFKTRFKARVKSL